MKNLTIIFLLIPFLSFSQINREEIYQKEKELVSHIYSQNIGAAATIEILPPATNDGTICIYGQKNKIYLLDTRVWTTTGESAPKNCDQGDDWPRIRAHIRIAYSENITIVPFFGQAKGYIIGPNENGGPDSNDCGNGRYEAQHGIQVAYSKNVRIKDIQISKVYGDFVYLTDSENIWIDGVAGYMNCRQGIGVKDSKNILIENSNISQVRRSSVDLENGVASETIENVVIRNNTFSDSRFSTLTGGGGGDVFNVFFHHNNLKDEPFAVYMKARRGDRGFNQRKNIYLYSNVSDKAYGTIRGGHVALHGPCESVYTFDNNIVSQRFRYIHTVAADSECVDIQVQDNTLENGTDGIIWK